MDSNNLTDTCSSVDDIILFGSLSVPVECQAGNEVIETGTVSYLFSHKHAQTHGHTHIPILKGQVCV